MKPLRLLPVGFLLLICTGFARAETPAQIRNPQQTERSWVADEAEVLSTSERRQIDNLLTPLEKRTGAEVAVVTVNNLGGMTVEAFANDLHRRWGLGKKDKDNGVLILAAIGDRKARIEVGYGLEGVITDGRAGEIQRTVMTPYFRQQQYGAGLLAAAQAVADAIEGRQTTAAAPVTPPRADPQRPPFSTRPTARPAAPAPQPWSPPPSANVYVPPSRSSGGGGFVPLALLLVGGGSLAGLVIWQLSRPPKCPKCGTEMELLPEAAESKFLRPVQMLEQRLGAKDYKIWRCPKCHEQSVTEHNSMFSGIENCPACGNKTLRVARHTVERATEWSEGLERTERHCEWHECNFHDSHTRSTPRLPRHDSVATGAAIGGALGSSHHHDSSSSSSSSSSYDGGGPGSFGGGDSGGGGASSSW